MTDWRAVGVGFLVQFVTGLVGLVLPGIGQLAAGLLGGFVAGYMAGGGLVRGAWHGLLAGALGGLFLAVIVVVGSVLLGAAFGPLPGVVGGGLAVLLVGITVVMALDSAIAGAVGGVLSSE